MKIQKENGEEKDIYFENYLYRKLTEANLNRVTRGHDTSGYAIVSASRSEDNMRAEVNPDFNDE